MPDSFTNARAYFDPTFPSSGDGFSIVGYRNAFAALAFIDHLPLQPRAHNPADNKIMIRGRDASSYYNPVYYGDGNQRVPFVSGDTTAFATPVSNPRIDIVYMTPSGDYKIAQGTEAVSPTLPTLAPSGDSRTPICAVWNRPGQAKIVNFENKDSNTGDGYIYQDLRPWLRTAGAGSTTLLGTTIPIAPTGDAQATAGTATTAAKSDHVHGGVHATLVRGTGDGLGNAFSNMQGDVEFAGGVSQAGRRITIVNVPMGAFRNLSVTRPSNSTVKVTFDELIMQDKDMRSGWDAKKSVTIDITIAGAGGLDGGAEQANKIYFIYIIRNSNTGVVNGILSTSPTQPLIPSGFNQISLVSAVGNDNLSNFINFTQTGRKYCFTVWATIASGNVSPWTAVTLLPTNMTTNAGFVPPELSTFCFGSAAVAGASNAIIITNDNSVSSVPTTVAPNKLYIGISNIMGQWQFDVLTPNTLYWGSDIAGAQLYLQGFEINKLT